MDQSPEEIVLNKRGWRDEKVQASRPVINVQPLRLAYFCANVTCSHENATSRYARTDDTFECLYLMMW